MAAQVCFGEVLLQGLFRYFISNKNFYSPSMYMQSIIFRKRKINLLSYFNVVPHVLDNKIISGYFKKLYINTATIASSKINIKFMFLQVLLIAA